MGKKKIFIIIGGIVIVIAVIAILFFNISTGDVKNVENVLEIQPEEEIDGSQEFDTTIRLYFLDKTSGQIVEENRSVDARKLVDNPYIFVFYELMKGPESENLYINISKETKINSATLNKGVLTIDFNEKFLESNNIDDLYCVVNTMCEFNEVDCVRITINGEVQEMYKDAFVKKK